MSDSVPVELSATEALGLAARARAAARAPQPVPTWYGATFAVGFSLYGLGLGYALWADMSWLAGVLGGVFAAVSGALGAVVTRRGGVARGWTPGLGGPMARWVVLVFAGALAVAAVVGLMGADARGTLGSAGVTAGVLFWLTMVRVNIRIRREAESV
ncbi:hypothetical protein [Kitasatospora purpeofusca]|uniref:hypothetical protein n=1 Tax=Kitasatospora purpeofusca TaxID=67352 RepID=UPI002A5A903F|nr:hypothetical protein [Kitasatospora purpeofusca]MDY0816001.1 hypothetical protein [Kitasatospora purpeofusca]